MTEAQPVPGYPGYPDNSGYPGYPPAPSKTNGMALASTILGIAGLTVGLCLLFFPVLPILAVILGHLGLSKITNTGMPGRSLAVAGLVMGYVGVALAVLWLVLVIIGTVTSQSPIS